jgi:hypothetical protein
MLITTDLILDAIAAIELQESGEQLSYHVAVKRCGVGRTTLCRRYVTRQPDVSYHEDASFSFSRSYLTSERPTPPTNADLRDYLSLLWSGYTLLARYGCAVDLADFSWSVKQGDLASQDRATIDACIGEARGGM